MVKDASATNGVFALVLGLLAFLYVTGLAVVLCTEINVVRVDHLYPRALLTPFTDDVDLTRGDKRTCAGAAQAQRTKEFEEVDVRFGDRRHPPVPIADPRSGSTGLDHRVIADLPATAAGPVGHARPELRVLSVSAAWSGSA